MRKRKSTKATGSQTDTREEPARILIVIDGEKWFIQHVNVIEHKLDFNRKVYHCDQNLAGPFCAIEDAVRAAEEILHSKQHSAAIRTA